MADKVIGKVIPNLSLESSAGGNVTFPNDIRGKWTLLYFYPKDDTPGCTKQACSYRDHLNDFQKIGVQVFGVSLDDLRSHDSFIQKYSLNFPLLADVEKELSTALGVYGEQEWKGKKYMGLSRDTFLIDPNGQVKEVWRNVNPETTVDDTLNSVKQYL